MGTVTAGARRHRTWRWIAAGACLAAAAAVTAAVLGALAAERALCGSEDEDEAQPGERGTWTPASEFWSMDQQRGG